MNRDKELEALIYNLSTEVGRECADRVHNYLYGGFLPYTEGALRYLVVEMFRAGVIPDHEDRARLQKALNDYHNKGACDV